MSPWYRSHGKPILFAVLIVAMTVATLFFPRPYNLVTFPEGTSPEEIEAVGQQMKDLLCFMVLVTFAIAWTVLVPTLCWQRRKKHDALV